MKIIHSHLLTYLKNYKYSIQIFMKKEIINSNKNLRKFNFYIE